MTATTSLAARRLRVRRDGLSVLVGSRRLSVANARALSEQVLDVLQFGGVCGDRGRLLRLEDDVLTVELGDDRARLTVAEGYDFAEALTRACLGARLLAGGSP